MLACCAGLRGQTAHAQTRQPSQLQNAVPYARAGWTALLSTRAHGVSGTAEIIDERTIVLRMFNYDGGGPAVYAYLGAQNTNAAFDAGLSTDPMLNRSTPYVNETITVTLAPSQSLNGMTAISIWCADFKVNFGSGVFMSRTFVPVAISAGSAKLAVDDLKP